MLVEPKITAFLATINLELSKQFYQDKLGLKLHTEDDYGFTIEESGRSLRITKVDKFTPQAFTVLGFNINNISSQVKSLISLGLDFEKYASLDQDVHGIWLSPSGAKIAWFKDPDGNILSLTEY